MKTAIEMFCCHVNLYASPKGHPVSSGNPAPWLIQEMRVELTPIKVWIRNYESMWFRADQCYIGTEHDLLAWRDAQ